MADRTIAIMLVCLFFLVGVSLAKRCQGRFRSGWSCRARCDYSTGLWDEEGCISNYGSPSAASYGSPSIELSPCLTISNKTCNESLPITTCITKNALSICLVEPYLTNGTTLIDQWDVCSPDNDDRCSKITPTCNYHCESPREGETKCSYEHSGGAILGTEIPAQHGDCDDESGPCYAPCMCEGSSIFCNVTNTCIPDDAPCGDRCEYLTFCPHTQTCIRNSELCGGLCAPLFNYCTDHCIPENTPCNATCPPYLQYCMASYSCLQYNQTCPCPAHTWGCRMYKDEDGSLTTEYQPGQLGQQQCDLADGETNPHPYPCTVEQGPWTFYVSAGDCHPKFMKNTSGQCVPG